MVVVRTALVFTALSGIAVLAACGDKNTVVQGAPAPAAACDSTKCLAGNTCLPLNGETKCRKTCASNDDPATSCPLGYICSVTAEGAPPFCVQSTAAYGDSESRTPVAPKAEGQWGTACQANLGATNPACDTEQGFYCFALSPSDGNAYCTSYGCEQDSDCGAGFGCESINNFPNANTAKRKELGPGATQKACVRRAYCSACTSDLDCPAIAGVKQRCIEDKNARRFCTSECTSKQNCPTEAKCGTIEGTGIKVCYPLSKLCIGDGALCSPCLSDADCGDDGICTKGEYTTERFCAKAAPGGDCKQCPKSVASLPDRPLGCTSRDSDKLPKSYCTGLLSIDGTVGADLGCWTPNR